MQTHRLMGVFAAALLTACATDGATSVAAPAQAQLTLDVAGVSADAAATDVELMRGPGNGPFGLGLLARNGHFECDAADRPNLTITRTCTYKDAAGATQAAYDSITTASVAMHVVVDGDVTRDKWSASVHRVRDLVVTGLAGRETQATWNGTGSGTATRVRVTDGTTRTYEITSSGTITNVVLPVPRTATGWPLSGTITKKVVVKQPDGTIVERAVTITFKGTQYATVTVNGETFEFDMSQRGRPRRP